MLSKARIREILAEAATRLANSEDEVWEKDSDGVLGEAEAAVMAAAGVMAWEGNADLFEPLVKIGLADYPFIESWISVSYESIQRAGPLLAALAGDDPEADRWCQARLSTMRRVAANKLDIRDPAHRDRVNRLITDCDQEVRQAAAHRLKISLPEWAWALSADPAPFGVDTSILDALYQFCKGDCQRPQPTEVLLALLAQLPPPLALDAGMRQIWASENRDRIKALLLHFGPQISLQTLWEIMVGKEYCIWSGDADYWASLGRSPEDGIALIVKAVEATTLRARYQGVLARVGRAWLSPETSWAPVKAAVRRRGEVGWHLKLALRPLFPPAPGRPRSPAEVEALYAADDHFREQLLAGNSDTRAKFMEILRTDPHQAGKYLWNLPSTPAAAALLGVAAEFINPFDRRTLLYRRDKIIAQFPEEVPPLGQWEKK